MDKENDIENVWSSYKEYLVDDDGNIDINKLKEFVHDYDILFDNTSKVFNNITNYKISNPFVMNHLVIAEYEAVIEKIIEDVKKDWIEELDDYDILSRYRKMKIDKLSNFNNN